MQTLAELKAENASTEETEVVETETPPQEVEEETIEETDVNAATEEVEETEEVAEPTEEETTETEVEDWMRGDDQPSDEIPNSAWKAAREQYKAKLAKKEEEHHNELDRLKAENEQLKQGKPAALKEPKLEDFDDNDDPQADYMAAMVDYKIKKSQAEMQATQAATVTQEKQAELKRKIDSNVDKHYVRAQKLAEQSGIKAETYQASDLRFRQSLERRFPGAGDSIANKLISDLGEGSEKVTYNLGVNKARLSELEERLDSDPSGIQAAMYLGQLKTDLNAPQKRKTNAPKPTPTLKGDAKPSLGQYERKYNKAKTPQEKWDIKREAKKAGVNVKSW